ncbi:MAG: GTPase HflX, partial [Lysobacteraceae bacterium]
LETDRRLLQKRVDQLQKRLEKVEVQQTQMRRARVRSEMPRVALVGYTNAGKSTLFNALTGSDAYAADKLFATLDPTVRRLNLAGGSIMLSDTVGFVRDLPHELVAAFRSTLSEAREADLLLHVIDAADPLREERIAQVDSVLQEIGAGDIPQVLVYNKIDRIPRVSGEEGYIEPRHDQPNPGSSPGQAMPTDSVGMGRERVWLSARDGIGLELLEGALTRRLSLERIQGAVHLPAAHSERLRSRLHALGAVRAETHDEHGWHLQVDLSLADARRLAVQAGGAPLDALLPEAPREEWMA